MEVLRTGGHSRTSFFPTTRVAWRLHLPVANGYTLTRRGGRGRKALIKGCFVHSATSQGRGLDAIETVCRLWGALNDVLVDVRQKSVPVVLAIVRVVETNPLIGRV